MTRKSPRRSTLYATALAIGLGLVVGCGGKGSAVVDPNGTDAKKRTNGLTLTTAGIVAFYEGEFQKAERYLRSAVAHDYDDELARYFLAKAYLGRGGPDGRMAAEEVLGDLTRIAEEEPRYFSSLARLRLRQGFRSNARRAFERLVELEPGDTAALFEIARFAETDWWRYQWPDDRQLAVGAYARVLEVDPDHRASHVRLAVLALDADSVRTARAHVRALARVNADHLHTVLLEGVILERDGEFETAETLFRSALERMPDFDREAYLGPVFLEPDSAFGLRSIFDGLELGASADEAGYWRRRDPTPGTELNERFVVHAARMSMSDFLYGIPREGLRGWETAPGEFYVRYGRPIAREYRADHPPIWLHTFRIGSAHYQVRFVDYTLNGVFRFPIENVAFPLHARLKHHRPEFPGLDGLISSRRLPLVAAWFREDDGEPRLEVAVPASREPTFLEASLLDTSWVERLHAAELVLPRPVAALYRQPFAGVLVATFHPGAEIAHVEMSVGDEGVARADLEEPVARRGFAMSNVVIGFEGSDGFAPNPGFPIEKGAPIGVRFEVYDMRLDANGVGYLRFELSVIPDAARRSGLAGLLRGSGAPSFLTTRFDEEVTARDVERIVEIDTSALDPGSYTVTIEVEDTIRLTKARAEATFQITS